MPLTRLPILSVALVAVSAGGTGCGPAVDAPRTAGPPSTARLGLIDDHRPFLTMAAGDRLGAALFAPPLD